MWIRRLGECCSGQISSVKSMGKCWWVLYHFTRLLVNKKPSFKREVDGEEVGTAPSDQGFAGIETCFNGDMVGGL